MKQQNAQQTAELPSLRIVYKTREMKPRRRKEADKKEDGVQPASNPVVNEPLPLFNDYRIKARDYDPL